MKTTSYVNGVSQALSQDFLDAWQEKQGKGGKVLVQAKRRYWNGSAFVYESSWQTFVMNDYVKVGNITWKLDTPLLNEFKTSSVPICFRGSMHQLLPTNVGTKGFFAPDSVATSGYEPYLTQFRIQFGYKIPSGDFEMVNLFTGVAIDYLFSEQDGFTEVTVSGNEALLQGADAQTINTAIDHGSNGTTTNTGTNKFTTNLPGVIITAVYDNGVLKTQGTDYTLSNTSSYGAGADIQLTYTAAGAITYDGWSWLTLQKVEDLVTELANAASAPIGTIDAVDWIGTATAQSANIGLFSGSDWSSVWTEHQGGPVSGAAGVLICGNDDGDAAVDPTIVSTPAIPIGTSAYGVWKFTAKTSGDMVVSSDRPGGRVIFISDGVGLPTYNMPDVTGYSLRFFIETSGTPTQYVQLERYNGPQADYTPDVTVLATYTASGVCDQHEWIIIRNSTGGFQVFMDGFLVMTATDNNYTNGQYAIAYCTGGNSGALYTEIQISNFTWTNGILLSMADFTKMTCYDAIQKLAKLANYEFGFDADGALFFRSKTPDNTVRVSIDQSHGISKLLDFRLGHQDIINVAQVTYGDYYRQYDSSSLPETAPTSEQRYLQRIESEDYTDFLLAYDPVIAASRAQSLHDQQYRARRRCRLESVIIPQLDLSDVAQFSFYTNPRYADNIWGDPLEKWGTSPFGKPSDVLARNVPGKTIGIILDPNNCKGEYELQEVL